MTVLNRVTPKDIKVAALTGTLRVTKHGPVGHPVKTSTLQDAKGRDILPPLRCAQVDTIDRDGLMVHGNLSHFVGPQEKVTRQAWWCIPIRPAKG